MHAYTNRKCVLGLGGGSKLAQELRPAVLSGCVWCLMRQRDVKTDSHNEMADGQVVEKETHIYFTQTNTHKHTPQRQIPR